MLMPIYQPVDGSRHRLMVAWTVGGVLADGRAFRVSINPGFIFDGASIPRFLWRVCGHPMEAPRVAAALAHDWLYAAHVCDRATADAIYRAICKAVGMGFIRRDTEYYALRLCGSAAWYSHDIVDTLFARSHGQLDLDYP